MSDIYTNSGQTDFFNTFNQQVIDKINELKRKYHDKKIVFTASCFDLLHPGHVLMLEDAKSKGDILIVALQTDPTINRKTKNKPVQGLVERRIMIESIKYVDEIIEYSTEADLFNILNYLAPDLRVLGSDWRGKEFTGHNLPINVYFHERTHDWSTSALRKRVAEAEQQK